MKRILVGVILAAILQMGLASGVGAALIPPTAECSATFKSLFQGYMAEAKEGPYSKQQLRQLDRKFAKDTAAAGCISDAGPLLKKMAPRPNTPKCSAAASAAESLWSPDNRKITRLFDAFSKKVEVPFFNRLIRNRSRTRKLKRQGGNKAQLRKLKRQRKIMKVRYNRLANAHYRRADRIVGDRAYANVLVLYEFMSLRCVRPDYQDIRPDSEDPVSRVMRQNQNLIFTSFMHVFDWTESTKASKPVKLSAVLPVHG